LYENAFRHFHFVCLLQAKESYDFFRLFGITTGLVIRGELALGYDPEELFPSRHTRGRRLSGLRTIPMLPGQQL
jgi:hypothetical protein